MLVFVADHGSPRPGSNSNYEKDRFKIPLLWLGGALSKTDTIIHTTGNQTDISKTILMQIGLEVEAYQFSQNLLSDKLLGFTSYQFNNGFGFIKDSTLIVFDNNSKKYVVQEKNPSNKYLEYGKAYLQVVTNYFNDL